MHVILKKDDGNTLLIMTKITRRLLVISIVCLAAGLAFVTGIIDVRNAVALYVALPAGAILFGLFLIFKMLEKETLLYDEEQRAHQASAKSSTTVSTTKEERRHSRESREAAAVQH